MVAAQTPTIAQIKNTVSLNDVRALLTIALCEICDFFNVGKNMNSNQIAITVDIIIENFGHLKLEEIKYCFRRAMMREKLFDRLDGNIILGWLREYDNERTDAAITLSEEDDKCRRFAANTPAPDAISFSQFISNLKSRALDGDPEASSLLSFINNMSRPGPRDNNKTAFFKWFYQEWLPKQKK